MSTRTIAEPSCQINEPTAEWVADYHAWLGSAGHLVEGPRRGVGVLVDFLEDPVTPSASLAQVDWVGRGRGEELLTVGELVAAQVGPAAWLATVRPESAAYQQSATERALSVILGGRP